MSTHSVIDEAQSRLAPITVRPFTDADSVDGAPAQVVAEPATADEVAAVLAWASARELTVAVRGGGTKLDWGGVCRSVDLVVSTTRLSRVLEHRHGDLTATVDAGTTLDALNARLAAHKQWLPLDPPWSPLATIGGILATNDSGPRRHRHGAPRDLIIGITVARPDAELAKAGGIVVKNVAGYDLSRLMTGAFGSLGVIVNATFKLAPVAPSSRTVVVKADGIEALASVMADVQASALTPTAVEVGWPPARALVRFDSVETAVAQQADEVAHLLASSASATRIVAGSEAEAAWADHARWWSEPGTLVKVTTLPQAVVPTLAWLAECGDVEVAVQGRASLGVFDVRLRGSVDAQVGLLGALRERFARGEGSAVIRRGSPELRTAIDPWGSLGDGRTVMRAIKQRFDPKEMLNPGRGPVSSSDRPTDSAVADS